MIVINEIRLRSFGSILRKPRYSVTLSLYLVAMKSPVMIPANDKMLLRNPFLSPSRAEIKTRINIIISRVFKLFSIGGEIIGAE